MPHFNDDGNDTYICQKCGRVYDAAKYPPVWRPDITGHASAGNVCPSCLIIADSPTELNAHDIEKRSRGHGPIDIVEHCRRESGLTGIALTRYINRHYGHG